MCARSIDDYITNYLLENRRTLIIDDVRAFQPRIRTWPPPSPLAGRAVEPFADCVSDICKWRVLGRAVNQSDGPRSQMDASEIALVEMVAAQVEVAVSHSNLFQETKQAAEREALISHIIHGINQSNRSDEIFPIVTRELAEHLAADRIVVTRLNEATGMWATECEYFRGQS